MALDETPKRWALAVFAGRRRWVTLTVAAAVAASVAGVTLTRGGGSATAAPSAPQSYDLTTSQYCTAATGLVTPALNQNLISNSAPTTGVTTRGTFYPGTTQVAVTSGATTYYNYTDSAGTIVLAGGTSITDPAATLLPDCWLDTSTLAASDVRDEIAMARGIDYPGSLGTKYDLYGGYSANDSAPAGTVTTLSQVIDLSSLGDVGGQPFTLAATLGGYTNQSDNATLTVTWKDGSGTVLDHTTLGPDLPANRDNISMKDPYSATGTVPGGATEADVLLTYTMGGGGNNDAQVTVPYLAIGSAPTFQTVENDFAGACSADEQVAPVVGANLVANPSAEQFTSMTPTSGPGTKAYTIPDCWTSKSGYFAGGVVSVAAADRTGASATTSGYYRAFDPNSDNGASTATNDHVFYGGISMSAGAITTQNQLIDLSGLTDGSGHAVAAAGQSYEFKAWLGGYQTQTDNASATVTFEDAAGNALATSQLGPISNAERENFGKPNGVDNSMLLPDWSDGTVPAGAAQALVTLRFSAYSSGNDDGMADDISLVLGGSAATPQPQNYDLTAAAACPAADQVTPALDANLIENPGAEDYTAISKLGAPGDSTVTVPDCWDSTSAEPVPEAVAESYAQSSTSYPPQRAGSRVFWGGTNPDGGIAGVTTKALQTIDLSSLGDVDGTPFTLSGLLGGYATQNDNAVVSATFSDAAGNTLDIATIGPVKAAQRNNVSSLVQQAWYGNVPAGATTVLITIAMTAVSTGNDLNGEADDLSLVIGDSAKPAGPILQTLPYDAAAGGDIQIDPTTGLPLPPAGGLYRPAGVSARGGVVYASNTADNVLAALQNGQSSVIAGSLEANGEHGDGGPAAKATLYQPAGTAVDAKGDVFVADAADNVVREITPQGRISWVAGKGRPGSQNALNHPEAVAVDAKGDVVIADTYDNRVVQVTPGGGLRTIAGTGIAGYAGDGRPAGSARLSGPTGLAFDAQGDLFIADSANNVIRRVDARTGRISTVAGNYAADKADDGLGGFAGDGGPATAARLNDPQGLAFDGAGDLFIADTFNNAVRELTPDGTISTVVNAAGANGAIPAAGGESSGVAPTASQLNTPYAVAVDPTDNTLYIADTSNSSIAEVLGVAKGAS